MRLSIFVFFGVCFLAIGCESTEEQVITLNSGEEFSFDLNVYGDEEGARIIQQAQHYSRSEIIRDSTTNWGAFYFYRSLDGYSGDDFVRIETCTGGKGIQCDEINTVEFEFRIN